MHIDKTLPKNLNKNILNFLIYLIPLSLIIGNFAVNINIILVCLVGFSVYGFQIFNLNQKVYKYLIYIFFFHLVLTTLWNNLPNLKFNDLYAENLIKSFFYLRFLILFLIINKMIEKKDFNLKNFYMTLAFLSIILALDALIQMIFQKNLIGYPLMGGRPTSFFGDEEILGGYLQKFSFFFILILPLFTKLKNNLIFNLYVSLFALFFFFIILSTGNRMPTILFLVSLLLFFVVSRQFKTIGLMLLISLGLFFLVFNSNNSLKKIDGFDVTKEMKKNYISYYENVKYILLTSPKLFYLGYSADKQMNDKIKNQQSVGSNHILLFNSGIQQWKENKIIGNGLKSFRIKCEYAKFEKFNDYHFCGTHPHNYTIEIMAETGLIGVFLIYTLFFVGFFHFIKFYKKNFTLISTILTFPFFLIIIIELFPLKSSGSFFTTSVSSVFFLMLPFFINIPRLNTLLRSKLS